MFLLMLDAASIAVIILALAFVVQKFVIPYVQKLTRRRRRNARF